MRIIGGQYRSRKLLSPPAGSTTRPIPDRVKESLFGILRGNIEGASVMDVFAGTGGIGLEALSRGAARCVFVERDKRVAEALKRNIETLGDDCAERAEVVVADALGIGVMARAPRPTDLLFLDPPYDLVRQGQPGGGWDRVKGQLSRLVEVLSDTGFAVLRTPWPFLHLDDPEEAEEPADHEPRRHKRDRRERERDRRQRGGGWEEQDAAGPVEDDGEEIEEDEGEAEETPAPGEPAPKRHPVDLHIPGAAGPETHVYRHTAVHLYMRKKERSDDVTE